MQNLQQRWSLQLELIDERFPGKHGHLGHWDVSKSRLIISLTQLATLGVQLVKQKEKHGITQRSVANNSLGYRRDMASCKSSSKCRLFF